MTDAGRGDAPAGTAGRFRATMETQRTFMNDSK